MKKLKCKCGEIINEFSVCVDKMDYRTDYKFSWSNKYSRNDREYFSGDVESIIYRCKCSKDEHKEIVVKASEIDNLNDFIRDTGYYSSFDLDDLKEESYGPIIVTKED